jgi:predicted PurR-regulated permease PerM
MMQRFQRTTDRSYLLRLSVILAGLLVVLSAVALLYIVFQTLARFGSVLVLFTLGAVVAYILYPPVKRVASFLGRWWAGVLVVYAAFAAFLIAVIVMVIQPVVSQSSSLVTALNHPSHASLTALTGVENQTARIETALQDQRTALWGGSPLSPVGVQVTQAQITALQKSIASLPSAPATAVPLSGSHRGGEPVPQIRIPPSYLAPLNAPAAALAADYARASASQGAGYLDRSIADAGKVVSAAASVRRRVSGTPVVILDAQSWADQHNIAVDVEGSAGQLVKKVTEQSASILSNTAGVVTEAGTAFVDLTLIVLISLYFVSDGARMIRSAVEAVPKRYREQAQFFVDSVDTVLGQSIRANILTAAIAGVLGGAGAFALGVPYAVLIGVATFLIQLIPIIGPMVVMIPPFLIALLFTTPIRAIILLVWYIVFEQILTNVISPRLVSKTVGIHPLEAMAAALIGYPLAGILGSLFAVPLVGLVHVLVKQAIASRKEKRGDKRERPRAAETPAPDHADKAGTLAPVHAGAAEANHR